MNRTLTIVLLVMTWLKPIGMNAQYEQHRQSAYLKLETGECDKARKYYDVWKEMTGEIDTNLEELIIECDGRKPAKITSNVGSYNSHEYVDLGLPSGLKWATCNVGANSPEEYGDYFAWGETIIKNEYNVVTSITFNKTIYELQTSDVVVSNGNIAPSHDAARQNWGGSWRLPTPEDILELEINTTAEWTIRNGVNGYKVTSKRNGRSIFLPAAGYRYRDRSFKEGESGFYWSSSPNGGHAPSSLCLSFDSNRYGCHYAHYRYYGQPVRPVSE